MSIDEHSGQVDMRPTPALWNPAAAARWSLLFSPIFGALIQAKNWDSMGEPTKAVASRRWALASVAFLVLLVVVAVVAPESRSADLLLRVAGLAMLIGWYYSGGKEQQTVVQARYGDDYPRKSWAKPLLYGLLAIGALLFLTFALVTILIPMPGDV